MKTSQKSFIQILSPIAVLLFVSACNVKAGPAVDEHPKIQEAKVSANSLEGKWSSGCVTMSGKRGMMSVEFSGDKVATELTLYSDEYCTSQIMNQKEMGTFTVGGEIAELPNAYTIDFSYERGGAKVSEFSIFQIEDGNVYKQLYMGEKSETVGGRPTTVDREHPLIKLPN